MCVLEKCVRSVFALASEYTTSKYIGTIYIDSIGALYKYIRTKSRASQLALEQHPEEEEAKRLCHGGF